MKQKAQVAQKASQNNVGVKYIAHNNALVWDTSPRCSLRPTASTLGSLYMPGTQNIQSTISALREIQKAGVTLAEATNALHRKENVPFDDIWPAIMKIRQVSEKEAMQITKEWCGH